MQNKRLRNILAALAGGLAAYLLLLALLLRLEGNAQGSSIHSFADALWYSIVTLTTVGYGDMYPVSPAGKLVGYIFVLASIGVLGYLIGQVSVAFSAIREKRLYGLSGTRFTNHVVIIGWDNFAKSVVDNLMPTSARVAVVANEKAHIDMVRSTYPKEKVYGLYADFQNFELIRKANPNRSAMIFINRKDDTDKLIYYVNCRKHFSRNANYAVIPSNPQLAGTFRDAEVDYVLSKDEIASNVIASYIFEPHVARYSEDLLSGASHKGQHDIIQIYVKDGNPFAGKSYNELVFDILQAYQAVLIGLVRQDAGRRQIYKNPQDPKLTAEAGDFLLLVANGKSIEAIEEDFGVTEGTYNHF